MTPLLFLILLQLPDGRGKATLIKACSSCHAPEAVIGGRNSRKGWTELVDEMIFKGAKATPRQRREIIDYLATKFPFTK
jgi:hypothetical protein